MTAATLPTRRLKYAVQGCFNGVWGDEANGVDDLAVVRVADFNRERSRVELGDEPTVRAIPQSARNRRVLAQGDLLIEKSGGGELQPVGNVVSFDDERPSVCSNFVARMPVANDCASRFVAYVFRSLYEQGKNIPHIKQTSGIQNLDSESYLNEIAWLPERDTQLRIANFLDDKTARIDALIAEKERLAQALLKYEASEVTATVTRGLNPSAKVVKANQTWLGDVPSHWAQNTVRRVCTRVTDGAHISPDLSSPDFPFVSTVDISEGAIDFDTCLRTAYECYSYLVRSGCQPLANDVLFSKDGTIGRTAVVGEDAPEFVVASSLVILSPRSALMMPAFLNYWLNNELLKQHVELLLAGAALRRISVEKVSRLPVLVPPMPEQAMIVSKLNVLTQRTGLLAKHTREHIVRLREYRSSLISAAVTGQIDVGAHEMSAC